jgi:hypothetical protein
MCNPIELAVTTSTASNHLTERRMVTEEQTR